MAEYITIMIINNKTAGEYSLSVKVGQYVDKFSCIAQITSELEDCESTGFHPYSEFVANLVVLQ
jgi:hypothetical protein